MIVKLVYYKRAILYYYRNKDTCLWSLIFKCKDQVMSHFWLITEQNIHIQKN